MLNKEDFFLLLHNYSTAYDVVKKTGNHIIVWRGEDKEELEFYKDLAISEGKAFVVVLGPKSINGAIELMRIGDEVNYIERKEYAGRNSN